MADPLSISASIAGLLSLADIVFSRVFRYAKAVQGSDSEIAQLAERTQSLSGVLHSLLLLAMELDTEGPAHEFRFRHLISCGNTLRKIKQKLESKTPTSSTHNPAASVKNKLLWPFSSSETKKLVAELSEHQTAISQATTADSLTQLLSALSIQNDIRDGVERLQDCFDDIKDGLERRWELETRISISEERQKVLDFFGNVDPSSNHNTSLQLRHPGTGQWLIDHELFRRWQKTPASKLWLSGIPGAGKTVLASLIIEESLKGSSNREAVAYFYCDYKDRDRQNPVKILGSLAAQISKQDESQESFKILEGFYAACHPPGRGSQFADAQMLVKSIQDMSVSFDEVSIIVDGLDECDDNQIEVVEVLCQLNADEYSNIRTLFLSRDEQVLRIHLEGTYNHISIAAHNDDLRFYVEAEVELRVRKRRLRVKNPTLKQEIVERLVDGADGMFRWVVCQLDYLCELPDDAARRKALKNLPPDLFATYERILERVNRQGREVQELVENTLRMLLFESSMPCNVLCGALAIKDGVDQFDHEAVPDDEEVLIRCSSLVRRVYYHPGPGNSSFQMSHFTVKEFLVSIDPVRTKHLSRYHLNFVDARTKVLCMQLTYLALKNSSSELDKSLGDLENRLFLDPLRTWAIYSIRDRLEDSDNQDFLKRLKIMLDPAKSLNFLAWVQDTLFWDVGDFNDDDRSKFRLVTSAIASGSMTTLHFAAMLRLPKLVEWLLSCGCEPNQMSDFGTPVHCALSGLVLSSGIHPQLVHTRLKSITEAKATLEVLLSGGATCSRNTAKTMWRKETSAMGIVLQSNKHAVLLLQHGADPGQIDKCAWNFLHHAAMSSSNGCFKILEQFRIPDRVWQAKCPLTVLGRENSTNLDEFVPIFAAKNTFQVAEANMLHFLIDLPEVMQHVLVNKLLAVDCPAINGYTPLHHAVLHDKMKATKLLISHGANVNARTAAGVTVLHFAAENSLGLFKYLLEAGAEPNAITHDGNLPLHIAASLGKSRIVSLLLESGSIDARNAKGMSPKFCALAAGQAHTSELISEAKSQGTNAIVELRCRVC
ncbi:hypothetical protein HDK90DRAFT_409640 [Phyllosticta capitalensis]|uniref:Nephrocystin 3-like N-terminal domain-containing protein n=1 Tax=Phyllosticta capitalensis TaxID=121624 RepID=A0ABR1YXM2_9PEZI